MMCSRFLSSDGWRETNPNVNAGDLKMQLTISGWTWWLEHGNLSQLTPIISHKDEKGHQRPNNQQWCILRSPYWPPQHPLFGATNMGLKIIVIFACKNTVLSGIVLHQMAAKLPSKNAKRQKDGGSQEGKKGESDD